MKKAEEAQDATQNRLRKEGHSFAPGPEGQEDHREEAQEEAVDVYEFSGDVVRGLGQDFHLPTANVDLRSPIEAGTFTCLVISAGGDLLGQGMIWAKPGDPIVEVYVAGFKGDLYDTRLTLHNVQRISRDLQSLLCDVALKQIPLPIPHRYTGQSEKVEL